MAPWAPSVSNTSSSSSSGSPFSGDIMIYALIILVLGLALRHTMLYLLIIG